MKRYAAWCRKQGRTAQCSPVFGVIGILVVFAAVIYVYRQVILTTIITAALAAVSVCVFAFAVMVTISSIRWYRKRSTAVRAEILESKLEAPDTWTKTATDADAAAISEEADWLASGVELAFSPDGKLVKKER